MIQKEQIDQETLQDATPKRVLVVEVVGVVVVVSSNEQWMLGTTYSYCNKLLQPTDKIVLLCSFQGCNVPALHSYLNQRPTLIQTMLLQ